MRDFNKDPIDLSDVKVGDARYYVTAVRCLND